MTSENPYANLIGFEIVPYLYLALLLVYFFVAAPILVKRKSNLNSFHPDKVVYFESKLIGYWITVPLTLIFAALSLISFFGIALALYFDLFLQIGFLSLVALTFTSLFSPARIAVTDEGIVFEKGSFKTFSKWSDLKGIHFNPAPSMWAGVFHGFKSTSFLIETTTGITKYIDGYALRTRDSHSFVGKEMKDLLVVLEEKTGIQPSVGRYSELTDRNNGKKNIVIVIMLLLVVAVAFWYSVSSVK